ncbi:MAG: GHMP kinase [Syntrophales bacterium]|nr:GHMP kinase [Syntrophales bacterium]
MVIVRTPFRISFFGGGTDYPAWYERNGGAVLAAAINKYCYLTCRYLPPFFEHRIRVVYSKIENCSVIDEIQHPAVREILRYMDIQRGIEIHHDGDLPARSGIGSSSSFTVGLLHALYALKGRMVDKETLARESIHIEQNILKETVGSQDQIMAAYGGFNHITFKANEFNVTPITISKDRISHLQLHLMLFYTGIKRTAAKIAETYVNKLGSVENHLIRMSEFVEEGLRILNSSSDIKDFGRLLHEAWMVKKDLSDRVTNHYVDELYETALSAGAIGGKLLGAGGGGFMLLFVPPEQRPVVRERLKKLVYVPFSFDYRGSQVIFNDPQEDYTELDLERRSKKVEVFEEREFIENGEKI